MNTAVADEVLDSNPCRIRGAANTPRAREIRPAANPDALLFPGRDGVSLLQPSTLHRNWRMAREAAGRPDLRVHDLRHTGAPMAARGTASH